LQASTSSSRPIFLRTEATAGHGIGTALATRIAENADVYAFLVGELGMQPVAAAAKRR
jgi:prolyl oligopeptidase